MAKMKNPNGYGCIKKLSGNRRKPWALYVTTGYALTNPVPKIDDLREFLTEETFRIVSEEIEAARRQQTPTGRQVQKAVGYYVTRQEAMIAQAEYNKNPYDLDARKITFGEIYNILFEKKFSQMAKSAKNTYVYAFKKCDRIAKMRMCDIKKAHMQDVIDQYADKSKGTQNGIIILCHAIYEFCLDNEIVEKDYSDGLKITSVAKEKAKTPFSREEIKKIWRSIDWTSEPNKGCLSGISLVDTILVQIYTGIRISELLSLKKEDLHLNERWIDLHGTKTDAAVRIVPIHKQILPLLEKRFSAASDGEFLFRDNKGKQIKYPLYLYNFFEPFMEHMGMNHSPHECRHTFISIAAGCNLNQSLMKKIVGHATQDITEKVYTHAYIEDLLNEIDKFDIK